LTLSNDEPDLTLLGNGHSQGADWTTAVADDYSGADNVATSSDWMTIVSEPSESHNGQAHTDSGKDVDLYEDDDAKSDRGKGHDKGHDE
jgi:hypothetical protein